MVLVDGVIESVMPDIITMLNPEDASVAGFEDLWVGNMLDIVILAGADRWYTPEGLRLAVPEENNMLLRGRWRGNNK